MSEPKACEVVLLVPYYQDSSEIRQHEIDGSVWANSSLRHIGEIVLVSESEKTTPAPKTSVRFIGRRATYEDMFQICNRDFAGRICVVANADILFDETLAYVFKLDLAGTCLALTRHNEPKKLFKTIFSQDAWIFRSPIAVEKMDARFEMGRTGCDNRIAYELEHAGLKVLNPCMDVVITHNHRSRVRSEQYHVVKISGPYREVPVTMGLFAR